MQCLTDVMLGGTFSPVASTGISSYLLKLIPVLPVPNSSISRRSSRGKGIVQSLSLRRSLRLSFHLPPPPPPALSFHLSPPRGRSGSCQRSFRDNPATRRITLLSKVPNLATLFFTTIQPALKLSEY